MIYCKLTLLLLLIGWKFVFFREWYSYHFPELVKIVNDNYLYAKTAKFIGNRKEFTEEKVEELEEVVMDSGKARAIYDASRSSMGKLEFFEEMIGWAEVSDLLIIDGRNLPKKSPYSHY